MIKRMTKDEFIERAKNIHGNKYDYSLVDYINARTKVKIICPIHGIFEQRPHSHLSGCNCKKCNTEINHLTNEEFIKRSKEIHGNKYDYSHSTYLNMKTDVKIFCNTCKKFFHQLPYHHYSGSNCPYCIGNKKLTIDYLIEKSNIIHNNKYDYSLVEYINNKTKVKIICPIHGIFEQTPHIHEYSGCPCCKESRGEKEISQILDKYDIIYERQKMFDNCKNERKLPFDFYLINKNICIEFDGLQHHKPIKYWGGEKTFNKIKNRDKVLNWVTIVINPTLTTQ